MKKIIYRCIIVIFLLAFCAVSISSPIYAAADKIQLTDVSVSSKSEGTTVGDLTIDGSTIRGAITLPSKDNFAELKLSFINNDSRNYTIDSISDNYTDDYLDIEYRYDSVLSVGATSDVFAKIIYKQQITNQPDFSIENITITIKLTRSDGTSEEIVINPATSDQLPLYFAIIFASSIIIILVFRRLKGTVKYGIIAAIALLCSPMVVLAAEKYELQPVIEIVVLKSEYEQYDISIDLDDGSEPTIKKIKYGDTIGELPDAPKRTGYDHAGWEDEGGNVVTPETIVTGPITIKPKYIYNGFTITFDANGGEGEMTLQIFDLNTSTTLNANTFVRRGYEFKGWNTSSEGDGDNYNDVQQVSFAEKGEMTLYAKWRKLEATLLSGRSVSDKIHHLSGYTGVAWNSSNMAVTSFRKSEAKPDTAAMTGDNIISGSQSTTPIYAWFDNGIAYWWTEDIDPSMGEDSSEMFACYRAIKDIDLSDFDTYGVKRMDRMFYEVSSLTTLNLGDKYDTSKVTNMKEMFYGTSSLTALDLGDNFDTSKVTDMYRMFSRNDGLTSLDLGDKFETGNVWRMTEMFANNPNLASLDLGGKFDTSNVSQMHGMFNAMPKLTSLDLGGKFNTGKVTTMRSMFEGDTNLASLNLGSNFDTGKVTDMTSMFKDCSSLTELDLGDAFNTENVTSMESMFNGASSLTGLDLGDKFNTEKVTNMTYMFQNCKKMVSLDLGDNFDTGNVDYIYYIFRDCESLKELNLGDKFDTSKIRSASGMFDGCRSLTSLDLGDKFYTSNMIDMWSMFRYMNSLVSLDLGDNFDTSNVIYMQSMFQDCKKLQELNLGDKFDTSKAQYMEYMFYGLDSIVSLDLGAKFNTSNVKNMRSMFRDCDNLVTIYAPDTFVTTSVTEAPQVFQDSKKLVGGAGTVYDNNKYGISYAHIDGGVSNPGYFTRRP